MFSESFKIVYFAGVLASCLGGIAANCATSDPECNDKVNEGHLIQQPNYEVEEILKSFASSGQSLYWDHHKQNLYYVDINGRQLLRYNPGEKIPNYEIEEIPNSLADMGEGPHWDHASQNLYYVDINAGIILRHDYFFNKVYKAKVLGEKFASFIVPMAGKLNQFAVGCGRRVRIVYWNGYSKIAIPIGTLFAVQMNEERYMGNRFNDGKCDARGRLFAGTMRYLGDLYEHRWGGLYKYESHLNQINRLSIVKRNTGLSNGLAWNDKRKKFYFSDTADFEIKEYDYNLETGRVDIRHPKVVMNFRRTNITDHVLPDGMTIDTVGNIYVATFNDYQVYVINPELGKVLFTIKLPCLHVTSAAFGGPNLDILFVTTANEGGLPPPCGSVFKILGLGSQGHLMNKLKVEA